MSIEKPGIAIRGIRQTLPPGYVIGRRSPEPGQAELIHMKTLAAQLAPYGTTITGPPVVVVNPVSIIIEANGVSNQAGIYLPAQELANFRVGLVFTLPVTGSYVDCEAAPTVNVSGLLKKNGTTIGTWAILAGATSGTWTPVAGPYVFALTDFLAMYAPTTSDTTMTGLKATLVGTR